MSHILKKITIIVSGLAVIFAMTVATALPASAVNNMGRVRNYSGNLVKIACHYGHMSDTLEEKYPEKGSNSTQYCPNDTDQFKSMYDDRCIYYKGPGVKDGWYRLRANAVRRVLAFGLVKVEAFTDIRCGLRPWYNKT